MLGVTILGVFFYSRDSYVFMQKVAQLKGKGAGDNTLSESS